MRAVLMRVSRASIRIDGVESGSMGRGFVVLVGVKEGDGPQEAAYLAKKCAEMRIFEDENEKMNLNLEQVGGGMLVVSNFTLYADCSHGAGRTFSVRPGRRRPSPSTRPFWRRSASGTSLSSRGSSARIWRSTM